MGKYKCEVVKLTHGLVSQYQVLMNEDKCKWDQALQFSKEKRICCVYTSENRNIHVCKFCDEEVLMACNADYGPATMYCTFGEQVRQGKGCLPLPEMLVKANDLRSSQ